MTEINAIIILRAYEIGLCLLGPHRPHSLQPCLSPELGNLGIWVEKSNGCTLPTSFPDFLGGSGVQGTVQRGSGEGRVASDIKLGPQLFVGALTYLPCTVLEAIHAGRAVGITGILSEGGHGASVTVVR